VTGFYVYIQPVAEIKISRKYYYGDFSLKSSISNKMKKKGIKYKSKKNEKFFILKN
jgi:hypothetical protein